jgi:exosortase H (IPTLxxWG-CTERM-specific)
MFRFASLFVLLFVVLFGAYLLKPVEIHVIDPFTSGVAYVSTAIIDVFDASVIAQGKEIISTKTGFGVSIERGCNGLEAVLLLFAAMFAFPAPWKHRFIGFALGFIAIQALNVVRIISLFYIGDWETSKCVPGADCHRVWFDWFHLYLWQALIILDATVVWLIWLRYLPRTPPRRPPPPATSVASPA